MSRKWFPAKLLAFKDIYKSTQNFKHLNEKNPSSIRLNPLCGTHIYLYFLQDTLCSFQCER